MKIFFSRATMEIYGLIRLQANNHEKWNNEARKIVRKKKALGAFTLCRNE